MMNCSYCRDPVPMSFLLLRQHIANASSVPPFRPYRDHAGINAQFCALDCLQLWAMRENTAELNIPPEVFEEIEHHEVQVREEIGKR